MPKKKSSKLKIVIWISAAAVSLLIFVGLMVLGTPNLNDSYPKNITIRDYKYELDPQPKHPKKGDAIRYSILVKNRETGRPVANTKFITIIDKAIDQGDRLIKLPMSPKEISRTEIESNADGRVEPGYALTEPGDYYINVAPADLWTDQTAVTAQEKQHPEYKGQPTGPAFRITCREIAHLCSRTIFYIWMRHGTTTLCTKVS
jgi:hypothetical protein